MCRNQPTTAVASRREAVPTRPPPNKLVNQPTEPRWRQHRPGQRLIHQVTENQVEVQIPASDDTDEDLGEYLYSM